MASLRRRVRAGIGACAFFALAVASAAPAADDAEAWFERGRGLVDVAEGVERQPTESLRWFLRAARAGHDRAQLRIGMMLLAGDGVRKDVTLAREWLTRSAEAGNPRAAIELGTLHRDGVGVPVALEEALFWFHVASLRGSGVARFIFASVTQKVDPERNQAQRERAQAWIEARGLSRIQPPKVEVELIPNLKAAPAAPAPGAAPQTQDGR